jgi:hypothetical protein
LAPRHHRLSALRARPALRYAILFVLGALLSGLAIRWGINPHDEGLMLQAGERIADGQLPYRDFYANYGPGQYFLVGGLDVVFGPSLLTWRILRVLLDAGVAVLAYALVRRDAPEPLALGAWLTVAAAMAFPSIPHPNPTALALGFGALLLAERGPIPAGALAGLAAVFRLDLGLAALAGVVILAGRRGAAHAIAAGIAVGAVLMAPIVIADPGAFWDQTIGFALDEQSLQRLPLPGAWEGGFEPNKILEFYTPYLLLAGCALWLAVAVWRRLPLRLWAPAPLAAAGVIYLLARADVYHLVPLAAVLPVLLPTAAAAELRGPARAVGATAVGVALVGVLALIAVQALDRKRIQVLDPPAQATIDIDVADGVKAPTAEAHALTALSRYVRARVPEGQPIFVANPRFDLVRVGNPLVYVLVGRPNPTRYDVMQPGVVTTAPVQREIVRDLERSRPRLAVRWLSPVADQPEDNGAGRSSGVHVLDRYLARAYAPQRRFGDYLVLARVVGGQS